MTARLLGDEERRQRSLVPERLVEGGGEPRQRLGDVRLDGELLMHGAVALRDCACVPAFVVARVCKPDGERAHGARRRLRHQRDDDARVDPAREQRTERHVGGEPHLHGLAHRFAHERQPVSVAARVKRRRGRRPVPLDPLGLAFGDEDVPRQ